MRPIPHPTTEVEADDAGDAADRLDSEEAMAGEEKWLDVQEF